MAIQLLRSRYIAGGAPDFSKTKRRYELQASTVDHALLQAGSVTVASYFGGKVAEAADEIIADAHWRTMYDVDDGPRRKSRKLINA